MNWLRFRKQVAYTSEFIPLRPAFWLLILIATAVWFQMIAPKAETDSYRPMLTLMLEFIAWVMITLLVFNLLNLLTHYILFHTCRKKNNDATPIILDFSQKTQEDTVQLHIKIPCVRRPLLGFVYVKLVYEGWQLSDPMELNRHLQNQFITTRAGLTFQGKISLADIRRYPVQQVLIYFTDAFRCFSLLYRVPFSANLLRLPVALNRQVHELTPFKHQDETIRIEQLRKVEGDYLHYKPFEQADDIRRIIWPVFARFGEWMVRVPETLNPWASHLQFFPSFFFSYPSGLYPSHEQVCLNYFKTMAHTLVAGWEKQGMKLNYLADQDLPSDYGSTDKNLYLITASCWQNTTTLQDVKLPATGSLILIHSFSSQSQVERLLQDLSEGNQVVFIALSRLFKAPYPFHWLKRIFWRPPQNRLLILQDTWLFHPLRKSMLAHEKKLIQLLKSSTVNSEIIS